jgi:hypothetical protein
MSLSADALDSLKVVELRAELTKRGLSSAGVKAELVKRLSDALQKDEEVSEASLLRPKQQLSTAGQDDVDILGDAQPAKPAAAPVKAASAPAVAAKAVPAKKQPAQKQAPATPSEPPSKTTVTQAVVPAKPVAAPALAPAAAASKTDAASKQSRAERFGTTAAPAAAAASAATGSADLLSEEAKARRAQRLGGVKRDREESAPAESAGSAADLVEAAKLEARAKKFGIVPPAKVLVAPSKLEARSKKFGGGPPKAAHDDEARNKRKERFGGSAGGSDAAVVDSAEAAKAKARAARFA